MGAILFQVEALARKYEEKYKLAGDVASKLTIEEATFRDIQVFRNLIWLSFYLISILFPLVSLF